MRKNSKVTVRYKDGRVEERSAADFRRPKNRRALLRWHRQSEHWRRLRRLALDRDDHRCTRCRGADKLEVHHRTYVRLGQERLEDVVTLCRKCHSVEHQWLARERRAAG